MARKKIETIILEKIQPYNLNAKGKSTIASLIARYPYELLLECINISASAYFKYDEKGKLTNESVEIFINKIGGIAHNKSLSPIDQELYHIINKAKKICVYWDDKKASTALTNYTNALSKAGYSNEEILYDLKTDMAKLVNISNNWSSWYNNVLSWTEEIRHWQDANTTTIEQSGAILPDVLFKSLPNNIKSLCKQINASYEKNLYDCTAVREQLFITTKVWIEHYGYEKTKASVLESMRKLKVDYLDLCLLHQPFADYYGAWRALEDLYEAGKIRAIGVSNFYPDRLVDIASFVRIKPMINQVETHPYSQQVEANEIMRKYDIQHEAWAPFAEGRDGLFNDETLMNIGKKYNKSVAQVVLRWHIQRGIVVIPKTVNYERMKENINIFDFELSDQDMTEIKKLDKQKSSFFSHADASTVEWFVKMVEERKKQ